MHRCAYTMRFRQVTIVFTVMLVIGVSAFGAATKSPASRLATPGSGASTPAAVQRMPVGALGAQILWLVDAINFPDVQGRPDQLTLHFAPSFLARVPVETVTEDLQVIRTELGLVSVSDIAVESRDYPPTIARFRLVGTTGSALTVSLAVNPASRQIDGLYLSISSMNFATPVARQVLGAVVPDGPLGDTMIWLLAVLNDPSRVLSDRELDAHFTPALLKATSADVLRARIGAVQRTAPVVIANRLIGVTMDHPPTTARCLLVARGGASFRLVVTIAPDSGRISAFVLAPVPK